MPALRTLALARDQSQIQAALRAYAHEINVSRVTVDEVTGWPGGYCGKVLSPRPVKSLSIKTLGEFMQATGLVLIVAQDVDAFAQRQRLLPQRNPNQARPGTDMRARFAAKKERDARARRAARRRAQRAARRAAKQGKAS
jgi:hypothetical protein